MQNLTVQKDFQQLKAPFAGVVTRRNTDVGALISASNGGQELFRVARTDILRVYVYVPQAYSSFVAGRIKGVPGFRRALRREIRGQGGEHRRGARSRHAHAANGDPGGQRGDGRLFPGAFANVHLFCR